MWMIIKKLQQYPNMSHTFRWKNDSLWYKDNLYHCKNSQLKQNVILELQTSSLGGHYGILRTYHMVKKKFDWGA